MSHHRDDLARRHLESIEISQRYKHLLVRLKFTVVANGLVVDATRNIEKNISSNFSYLVAYISLNILTRFPTPMVPLGVRENSIGNGRKHQNKETLK